MRIKKRAQLSKAEKLKIDQEIKAELLEHWFKAAPAGCVLAVSAATLFVVFIHQRANLVALGAWYIGLILMNIIIFVSSRIFKNNRSQFTIQQWHIALSCMVVITTMFWGSTILFNPENITQQFILLIILLIAAASFSLITVGMFVVCLISTCCVLLPITFWFFTRGEFYYDVGGVITIIYIAFISGMNLRSTKWLIHSLELSKMLASFTHQANYDLLTDLPNQRLLTQYIDESIVKVKKTNENFALVCFSINRLDVFNNSLGYRAGDLVINSVAKRFQSELLTMNRKDKIMRILTQPRADAFVLLVAPARLDNIEKDINQLISALDKPFHLGNRESRLTASVGVTIFPQDSKYSEQLLSNTYAAMFEARLKGGNQIVFYKTTMTSNAPLLLEFENDLHKALENKEFELYYQPVIDLQQKKITSMEALIRWNHPKRGLVSPNDFIYIAEETGLIIPMSEWIFEQAATQTCLWHKMGFDLKIAVNLSPKQIRHGNLMTTIEKVLNKTGIDPSKLELELTETAMLDESLSPLINNIAKMGIGLSIDDFGTGYSGLSYLKHFHIDKIKIDKSFIDDVVTNNDSAAIVTATLAMAKELGIKTLAEGIEKKDQLTFLLNRGCQYIQGYYFSVPLPSKAFEELLRRGVEDKF